ncbi:MAG: sigma 54-interacting transcriptional regulator [Veillonellales bacterium]
MPRIAFIAPDKHLFLQGKKIVNELELNDRVDFYLARLNRAVRLAKRLENEDVDVIVCRGGTAHVIIKSKIRIPVVEIVITGQDLAQVFYEAKKITALSHPKVAILAFKNMVYDTETLSKILDIDLTIYPLEETDDIPLKVAEVVKANTDVVVGGIKTIMMCKKAGLKVLPIRSGHFSMRAAFVEAQRIALGRKIEKEQTQEFKALIDYSIEGIISINRDKIIKVFNPIAEHLLKRPAKEVLGQKLDNVLTVINVEPCLANGQQIIGQTIQLDRVWLSFNIAPIMVDQGIIGAIINFQDITRIQEIEAKIRNEVLAKKMIAKYKFTDIIGTSSQMAEIKRISEEISLVDATVLISGESGTGKELFAQSIHNQSQRKNGPFVAVNCAALPSNLLESELFGYVGGAFTGATKQGKLGLFEMAHRGTIFLDEISGMDKYGQSRLLRVLQEKQVMRLGDDKYIPVDVRIIAATNKNLAQLVKEGHFRQDLFYRLKVLTINLPPLRKRYGDIKILSEHFLSLFNRRHFKNAKMTDDAYTYLTTYEWPGNVRELMYFIERLVVISREKAITKEVIDKYWDDKEIKDEIPTIAGDVLPIQSEKAKITSALAQCNSNISKAALLLGMDRSTLYRKLRTYKIEVRKIY